VLGETERKLWSMDQSQEPGLKIGEVARRAGVSVDTVRYYERRGILPPAVRLPSGYRTYAPSSADRILLARRLREVGLSIDEIVSALAAHDGGSTCASEVWRLEAVRERLEGQVAQLTALVDLLGAAISACKDGRCLLELPSPPASA